MALLAHEPTQSAAVAVNYQRKGGGMLLDAERVLA